MASRPRQLYEDDFYAWTRDQAAALRRLADARWNGPLDLLHLAEEVEDLGSEQRNAIMSELERVIEHLLKLECSPSSGPRRQWMISVNSARGEIERRMTRAIRREIEPALDRLYQRARRNTQLGLEDHAEPEAAAALPQTSPYTLDQMLQDDWYPTSQHGLGS